MRKLKKRIGAGLLALTMMFAMAGCGAGTGTSDTGSADSSGSKDSGGDTITIGTSFPMTGSVAADGEVIVNSIQLAADQINEAGGINGKTIELQVEDDEADPTAAASIANKLANDDNIVSVITSYNSSCGLAQIPVYKGVGLPALSPVTTSPAITGMSDYYYRVCNSDTFVGSMCADYCNKLGMTNVYVLYENDDYGAGIYEVYSEKLKELGITEAGVDTFVYGETKDFSSIITKIKSSGADGLMFIGLVTEMGLLANQAGDLGMPIFADEGCYSPEMIEVGGEAVEGLYSIGAFDVNDESEVVQNFVTAYKEKYDAEPSGWGAFAYDAAMTLFEAMKKCDTIDRESINEQLQQISYEGVTGLNKFENSDVSKDYKIFQIKDGAWTEAEVQ